MVSRVIGALCAGMMCASRLAAQTPQHGSWDVTTTIQGTPSGDTKSTKKACLSAAQTANGFEQAILDISASDGGPPKSGPKCSLKDLKRDGGSSSWQSTCDGPRGALQGVGYATIEANRANLTQSFEMKTPFGAMKLKQIIEAQRVGDCQ